jgi:hypothetical protein
MQITTPYLLTNNPNTENNATLYAPGELGGIYVKGDDIWQQVQVDSGATAAANKVLAVGDLLYWKNISAKIVTNDTKQALNPAIANSYQNRVAGVLMVAATPGNYVWVRKRGLNVSVRTAGSAMTVGQTVQADTSNTAAIVGVATGTQNTAQTLGVVQTATASSLTGVDLDIQAWVP